PVYVQPGAPIANPQALANDADADQAGAAAQPAEDDDSANEGAPAPQEASAASGGVPTSAVSEPAEDEGRPANSVTPSVYVNLRDGPSSSSKVIGVIAKGAKLPVLDRKRGWVRVTDPATSTKGWIYSGYVEGGHKTRSRTKRSASQDSDQKSQ